MKLRRSAPVRLAVAAPALLFVLELMTMFARGYVNPADPARLWRDLLTFGWLLWLGLFTPALVTFEAIGLAGFEHAGNQWKQLFTYPIPRWAVFAVKMAVCAALVGVGFALFTVSSVAAVLLFGGARGLHLAAAVPWGEVAMTMLRTWLACWLLVVIHTWLSARFAGFAVPAAVAFAAVLVGYILLGASHDMVAWWYPWTLSINARPDGLWQARNAAAPALFGALAGLALAPVACWDLGRRQEGESRG
jgi:hypothetical protein